MRDEAARLMALRLLHDPEGRYIPLARSPLVVGHHDGADVRIMAEGVQRRHALFVRDAGRWHLFSLTANKPARRNGRPVERAALSMGDRLALGEAEFLCEPMDAPNRTADGAEGTGTTGEAAPAEAPPPDLDALASEWLGTPAGRPGTYDHLPECSLEWSVDGAPAGAASFREHRVLGYSSHATLRLPKRNVSSLHALVAPLSGGWRLLDLRSEQGTRANGVPVADVTLTDGMALDLGDVRLAVRLKAVARRPGSGVNLGAGVGSAVEDDSWSGLGSSSGSGDSGVGLGMSDSSGDSWGDLGRPEGNRGDETSSDAGDTANSDFSLAEAADLDLAPAVLDQITRGRRCLRVREYPQAVKAFLAATKLAPFAALPRQYLRKAQREAVGRRRPAGRARLALVLAQWRACRAWHKGAWAAALQHAEAGLTVDPFNRGLLLIEAAIFEQRQQLDMATWCLLTARHRRPDDPHLNRALGRLFRHAGAYDRAADCWQRVAKANPGDREAAEQVQEILVQKTMDRGRYVVR